MEHLPIKEMTLHHFALFCNQFFFVCCDVILVSSLCEVQGLVGIFVTNIFRVAKVIFVSA